MRKNKQSSVKIILSKMSKRGTNWCEKECSLLVSAINKRERQCLGKTTGPGYEGPDKVTQATKKAAWAEVAAEIARSVLVSISISTIFLLGLCLIPLYY